MMFRENVLIALTLLVTILSLSYIIVLTVYLQINETERILKAKAEKTLIVEQKKQADVEVRPIDNEHYFKQMAYQQVEIEQERQGQGLWIQLLPNAPASPFPDFGFNEPHPPNAIKFPYQFYTSNGHVTLQIPENLSVNLIQERVLLDVVKILSEHLQQHAKNTVRKVRDSFLDSSPQDDYIWFKQSALQNMANKKSVNPDDTHQEMKNDVNVSSIYDEPPVKKEPFRR
ncbi:hypothetical protein Ocin01_01624 [Orchesella cincta]|uniref:Uncharacterized protein n=1 Tax=Orchesella cincta TaxID=48709 RepID=A0A1D2NIG0_ORCCI|nr:hypothetical protein Ocin01_01624 [Orchesella cincta]